MEVSSNALSSTLDSPVQIYRWGSGNLLGCRVLPGHNATCLISTWCIAQVNLMQVGYLYPACSLLRKAMLTWLAIQGSCECMPAAHNLPSAIAEHIQDLCSLHPLWPLSAARELFLNNDIDTILQHSTSVLGPSISQQLQLGIQLEVIVLSGTH